MAKKDKQAFPEWLTGLVKSNGSNKKYSIIGLIIAALLAILYLIYSLLFLGKVYPNSYIGGTNLAHSDKSALQSKIREMAESAQSQPINLKFQDQKFTITASDISFQTEVEKTADNIMMQGRQKPWWRAFFHQMKTLFGRSDYQMTASYDEDLLDQKVSSLTDDIVVMAVDATAQILNDKLVTTKGLAGEKINKDQLKDEVITALKTGVRSEVTIAKGIDLPSIIVPDVEQLTKQVDQLSTRPVTLTWSSSKKELKSSEIKQMIGFVAGDEADSIDEDNAKQRYLRASFASEQIESYLSKLSANIDQKAVDPKLVIKDGALSVAVPSKIGRGVDLKASTNLVFQKISTSQDPVEVELVIVDKEPVITEDKLSTLGIKEMVGRAETNLKGSTANRRANIVNGVSLLQSALIKPGDEFSTVKALGEVSDKTGFVPELVIKENKTTPEFGGGLCQVSTTLFRAVLNAGLKVTERRNHSYRVGYYEPPVGLDATIYLPKPDLRFVNDTSAYILIQGSVVGNKVIFEFWGTKDGRTATLTDPVLTNVTEPPEPIYSETDTLNIGETKQIEKPHQGATAVIEYTVTRNGQVINKQTFKSLYKPWAARFLVGTKVDPNAPPPATTPIPSPTPPA